MKKELSFSPLFTDLYELTMAAVYFEREMFAPATFSLFVRRYPPNRSFFVAAGLQYLLSLLEDFKFSGKDLEFLESLGLFKDNFLTYLENFRFSGEVWALPEGTVFFAQEPMVEITAPIIEAQLIETLVINILHFETVIATKAARCVLAAHDKPLIDFSARRTQGIDASLRVARSSFLAGFAATSNTWAGKIFGIPVTGTMAHSFIQSFEQEEAAFEAFAEYFPDHTVLLLDTYDTLSAIPKVEKIAKLLEAKGKRLKGVRLDSGDILSLSREVRKILDQKGLNYVKIFVSGGLDEFIIQKLLKQKAPIDAFGVGTKMGVSQDAPAWDAAYKLVSYQGKPVAKFSQGKATLPGAKQVFRKKSDQGLFLQDWIGLRQESPPEGSFPLLKKVMAQGKIIFRDSLFQARKRVQKELASLPKEIKSLKGQGRYTVCLTTQLQALQKEVKKRFSK